MSTRVWTETDPEPPGVRAVVDPDGVTWARGCQCGSDFPDDEDYDSPYWHEHKLDHLDGGVVTGGSIGNDWRDIFASLPDGSELREATEDEAQTWIESWVGNR